jgi:hypothetical protein
MTTTKTLESAVQPTPELEKLYYMLNFAEETILSTIKIHQAGFADCIDTHVSFKRQLSKLREMRIIP